MWRISFLSFLRPCLTSLILVSIAAMVNTVDRFSLMDREMKVLSQSPSAKAPQPKPPLWFRHRIWRMSRARRLLERRGMLSHWICHWNMRREREEGLSNPSSPHPKKTPTWASPKRTPMPSIPSACSPPTPSSRATPDTLVSQLVSLSRNQLQTRFRRSTFWYFFFYRHCPCACTPFLCLLFTDFFFHHNALAFICMCCAY